MGRIETIGDCTLYHGGGGDKMERASFGAAYFLDGFIDFIADDGDMDEREMRMHLVSSGVEIDRLISDVSMMVKEALRDDNPC